MCAWYQSLFVWHAIILLKCAKLSDRFHSFTCMSHTIVRPCTWCNQGASALSNYFMISFRMWASHYDTCILTQIRPNCGARKPDTKGVRWATISDVGLECALSVDADLDPDLYMLLFVFTRCCQPLIGCMKARCCFLCLCTSPDLAVWIAPEFVYLAGSCKLS